MCVLYTRNDLELVDKCINLTCFISLFQKNIMRQQLFLKYLF